MPGCAARVSMRSLTAAQRPDEAIAAASSTSLEVSGSIIFELLYARASPIRTGDAVNAHQLRIAGLSPRMRKFRLQKSGSGYSQSLVAQNQHKNFRAFCLPMNLNGFWTPLCNRARLQSCRKWLKIEVGFSPLYVALRGVRMISRFGGQAVSPLGQRLLSLSLRSATAPLLVRRGESKAF